MTRKESIFYIEELQKTYASMDKKVAEAVDMATEALSAPQIDLISRTEAIEAVIEYWDGYAKPLDSWDVMNQTRAVLETLPSAEGGDAEMNEVKSPYMQQSRHHDGKDLISRADAIEAVEGLKERPQKYYTQYNNGLSDAVLKLTALPSAEAPTGELISRADAIEAVRMSEHRITIADEQGGVGTVKWDMWGVYTAEAVEAIKALTSAEAVQGEWEHWGSPFSDESEVIDTIVCSICGARFIEPKDEPKGEYNFCPNCGARMNREDGEV